MSIAGPPGREATTVLASATQALPGPQICRDAGDVARAEAQGRNRLRTAHGPDRGDAAQIARPVR